MFKNQKVISCISKVVILLLGLATFGHCATIATQFVDGQNPEAVISGSLEPTVNLGGITVNNNEMDASTCNFTPLDENFLVNCRLGYEVSYTYNKKGKD